MFKKEIISVLILIFFIVSLTGCVEDKDVDNVTYSTLYVDDGGGSDYTKIQDAIKNIDVGGTIYVKSGTYNEILKIDKKINLIGDVNDKVEISNNSLSYNIDSIVTISADNCTFSGFNISFSYFTTGIKGINITSSNNTINFCDVSNTNYGIFLDFNTENNNILNCTVSDTKRGIYVYRSFNNLISNNRVINTDMDSIYLHGSDGNILSNNMVVDNYFGILVQGSDNNVFYNNTMKNNSVGLKCCCGSLENVVYNNNFIENYLYNARDDMNNMWDNGTVGNYWDDYVETYPDAKQVGDKWDTPYEIICDAHGNRCGDIVDNYPLVNLIDG